MSLDGGLGFILVAPQHRFLGLRGAKTPSSDATRPQNFADTQKRGGT